MKTEVLGRLSPIESAALETSSPEFIEGSSWQAKGGQRTPLSPARVFAWAFQRAKMLREITSGKFTGKLEDASCPICMNPPSPGLVFKTSDKVGIWKCRGCEIMYASPRFSEESLLEIYENEEFVDDSFYHDWSYENWKRENTNRSYIPQTLKIQLVRRFLSQKDRILDVGCGTGLFCLEASKQGLNVEGIDPSDMLIEFGRRLFKIPLHHGHIEDFDPGYKYKGIVLWAVLEHVYNLKGLIKRCGDLLEDGGYLFIDVPHHNGASNRFKTFLSRKGLKKSDFKHFGFPWHLYSFNKKSLSRLTRACGFEPVLFEFWSHLLKDGANGRMARIAVWLTQKFEFSDYITLVAKKRGGLGDISSDVGSATVPTDMAGRVACPTSSPNQE